MPYEEFGALVLSIYYTHCEGAKLEFSFFRLSCSSSSRFDLDSAKQKNSQKIWKVKKKGICFCCLF